MNSYTDDYSNSTSTDAFPNSLNDTKNKLKSEIIYYHFNNSKDCETFINLIKPLYKIKNTCCGGIGFGINSLFEMQVGMVYNKFIKDLDKSKPNTSSKLHIKKKKSDNDVCCICLENCEYRTSCEHTLCKECLQKGERDFNLKLCPICRITLKNY